MDVSGLIVNTPYSGGDGSCDACGEYEGGNDYSSGSNYVQNNPGMVAIIIVVLIICMYLSYVTWTTPRDGFKGASHPMDVKPDFPWELQMSCPTKASA